MGMLDLFREWLERRNGKYHARRQAGFADLETLESRLVLSPMLSGTTLTVDGTGGNDTISVSQTGAGVTIVENSVTTSYPSSTTINAINVVGEGGNEQITINSVLNTTALTVNGGTGFNTLISPSQSNLWIITGPNSGTLNGNPFSNIENLIGGGFNDDFRFAMNGFVSGNVDGGGGLDSLDYSTRIVGAVVNLATSSATAIGGQFSNIDNFIGSADNTDMLIGANTPDVWHITGGSSGDINGNFFYSGVENLVGGSSGNDFVFEIFGIVGGSVTGGIGNNTLDYSNLSTPVVTNLQAGASTLIAAGFNQIGTIIGSTNPTNTLIGINQSNVWNITSPHSGTINSTFNTTSFQKFDNLIGGVASDRFKFYDGAFVSGFVNGGGGYDTLDYSPRTAGVTVNLQTSSATAIGGGFTSIEAVVGSQSTTDDLIGLNTPNNFNITGPNSGNVNGTFAFSSFENLTGGNANDSFNFYSTSFVSGVIAGGQGTNTINYSNRFGFTGSAVVVNLQTNSATSIGGGFLNISNFIGTPKPGGSPTIEADTLIGPNSSNLWTISGADIGNLNGQVTYNNFENLTGGLGADVFKMLPGGSISGTLNGGPVPAGASGGQDWLDYSSLTTPVTVNLATGVATDVGMVMNVQNVHGSNASTTNAITTLAANVTSTTTTTFVVTASTSLLVGELLKVDSEMVRITAINGSTINVARAQNGTSASVHAAGTAMFAAYSNNLTGSTALTVGELLRIGIETVRVAGINGSTITVARGQNFSGATVHFAGDSLYAINGSNPITTLAANVTSTTATTFTVTTSPIGNVLVGGQGSDFLVAGTGPSVLIGGLGSDSIIGGAGQDILIGGYTDYDTNFAALSSILAEWQSSGPLNTRVNDLRNGGGLNGNNVLVADVTVHNDSAVNSITAGASPDWLWGSPAELKNVTSQDIIDVPLHNQPVLTGTNNAVFIVGRFPVLVDPNIQITDTTSATIASATVSVGANYNGTEDSLSFAPGSNTGNIVGSFNSTTGVLTLTSANATATVAQFQTALRQVAYYNSSPVPTTATRTVDFQVFDGTLFSNSLASPVSINTPPILSGSSTLNYGVLQAPTVINPNISITDTQSNTLMSATVAITGLYQPNQDILSFTGNALTGDIVGSFNSATGVLTLTAAGLPASVAQYQQALRLVTYQDFASFPLTATRTVTYQASDAFSTSNSVTSTIVFD